MPLIHSLSGQTISLNKFQVTTLAYSVVYNLVPEPMRQIFTLIQNIHMHNLRGVLCLQNQPSKKMMRKFSMRICGPLIWNKLPTDLKLISSLKSFKSKLKAYLREGKMPSSDIYI